MISASAVKELRDKTGAGMMDCKKALTESGGDFEKAIDYLRKSGMAKAEKKAGRAVKEGRITAMVGENSAVMLEVLCETDFVASNEVFNDYIKNLAERLLDFDAEGDISQAVQEAEKAALTELIAKIGENMQIRRVVRWKPTGKCASYLHMGGRIGVLVDVSGIDDDEVLSDICMHIAAFNPLYIKPEDIPEKDIEKEKEIAGEQVGGNKPPEIMEKIVTGKLRKWYSEICLMNQPWLRDDKTSLAKLYPDASVKAFLRWMIGEELD